MKILMLSGIYDEEIEQQVKENSKRYYDIAALSFERKLYSGFKNNGEDFIFLSAPFIGSFPDRYKKWYFRPNSNKTVNSIKYVPFNNVWGIRNISRTFHLKKEIKNFCMEQGAKGIVVYGPHVPFMETAKYAKQLDPQIQVCLIVPELSEFAVRDKKRKPLYRLLKPFDIKRVRKLYAYMDSYVLLTEQMKEYIPINHKPYFVVPGITVEPNVVLPSYEKRKNYITFTGNLNSEFGILNLLYAFEKIKRKDYMLIICGGGENEEKVREAARLNERIRYLGVVTQDRAREIIAESKIVVSPRTNVGEYTKYTFPSKMLEYMSSGGLVVSYDLDGMGNEIRQHLILAKDNSVDGLVEAIDRAINMDEKEAEKRRISTQEYLKDNVNAKVVTRRIKKMMVKNNEIIKE